MTRSGCTRPFEADPQGIPQAPSLDSFGEINFLGLRVGHRCQLRFNSESVSASPANNLLKTKAMAEREGFESRLNPSRAYTDFSTTSESILDFPIQNRNFLITRSCSFRVAFCSLPPNKVIARFLGHAFGDFAEPWVAYPGHGMDRSREREQSRCRNDAKMPLAA
jgi:hypothetical protein